VRRDDRKIPVTGPIRLLMPEVAGHRRRLVSLAALSVIGGLAEACVLVIAARLAFAFASSDDAVTVRLGPLGETHPTIATLLSIAAGLVAFRLATQIVAAKIASITFADVRRRLRTQLMALYLGASWEVQSAERAGKLQEYATTFTVSVAISVFALTQLLAACCNLAIFVATALAVNAVAAGSVAIAAVGMAMLLRPIRHAVRQRTRAASKANLAYATDVSEIAQLMEEVRIFDVKADVLRRIQRRIDETARLDERSRFIGQLGGSIYQGTALLLIVGGLAIVWAADLTQLASFGGILLIVVRSLNYGQAAQSAVQLLQSGAPSLEMLNDERARLAAAAVPDDGAPLSAIGELRFDDVSFAYTPGRPVLQDLSFSVGRGEIVGIVGPSGAGKSTLVQLLLRLREPTSGRMLIDGEDARTFSHSDWFRRVSFVPQEARLFSGTIADNIAFYRGDVDRAAVERAARQANLHDEVVAIPEGYDSQVGEGGGRLSGGQRQRLSIARALAEDPDVLVLDEPTSSLDAQSEALIRASVAALAPRTTVFIIAHRLSTLDICDRIMVIRGGRLQGFDTPSSLERNDPFYREALALSGLR
jgi:ATP-binding cassette subfamily B protein